MGIRVADTIRNVPSSLSLQVHQQAVINGIPSRSRFEIHAPRRIAESREQRLSRNARIRDALVRASRSLWEIREENVLTAHRAPRGMHLHLAAGIRLVYIEKAAEMHATQMDSGNAEVSAFEWLELERGTCLDAIRRLAVLLETHDCRVLLKTAIVQRRAAAQRRRRGVRIGGILKQSIQGRRRK